MARYIFLYNLNQIRPLDRKLKSLEPEIGNLREMMNGGIMIFCGNGNKIRTPKKKPVNGNPQAKKMIMDLRNGINCELLMGYG